MATLAPALLAGVTLGAWLPVAVSFALMWCVCGALLWPAFRWPKARPLLVMMLALAATRHYAVVQQAGWLDCPERVLVQARVLGVPERVGRGWRFAAQLAHPRQVQRAPLRASVEFPASGLSRPRAGETWQLALRYVPFDIAATPQGATARRHALRERHQVRARVIASPLNRRLTAGDAPLHRMRERVADRIRARVADPAAAALLAALAVGVTGDVSRQQWRDFSVTGITHLVAISGMHVTFFALLSMWAVRRLWNLLPALQPRVRRERCAAIAGLLLATGYALLSGFSVPAQRTLLMLAAWQLGRECARAFPPLWSLWLASCAVLALDPLAVLGAGFWLSFVAVAAIILLPGSRAHELRPLPAAAAVQFAVSVALLPLTVLLFGSFSLAGLAVNALAIPLFTFLLVPGALLATLGYLIGAPLDALADLAIDLAASASAWMLPLLARAAQWPWANIATSAGLAWVLLMGGAAVLLVLPLRPSLRMTATGVLLLACSVRGEVLPQGVVQLQIAGAGEDTAVIVSTARHRLVFGTGEIRGSGGARFERVLLPVLRTLPPADMLIAGRLTADRLAALTVAVASLRSPSLYGTGAPRGQAPEVGSCSPRNWEWDDVRFELSAPGRGCALRIRLGNRQALLTLDLDAAGWKVLSDSAAAADVLLLPHVVKTAAGLPPHAAAAVPGVLIASAREHLQESSRERQWRLRDVQSEGRLLVRLSQQAIRVRRLDRLRWGVWSGARPQGACP